MPDGKRTSSGNRYRQRKGRTSSDPAYHMNLASVVPDNLLGDHDGFFYALLEKRSH